MQLKWYFLEIAPSPIKTLRDTTHTHTQMVAWEIENRGFAQFQMRDVINT